MLVRVLVASLGDRDLAIVQGRDQASTASRAETKGGRSTCLSEPASSGPEGEQARSVSRARENALI